MTPEDARPPQETGQEPGAQAQQTQAQQQTPAAPASSGTTRRELLRQGGLLTLGAAGLAGGLELLSRRPSTLTRPAQAVAAGTGPVFNGPYDATDKMSSLADITGYNNYYEFGTDKTDPAANAGGLKTHPWAVTIDGLVRKPQTMDVDALVRQFPPVDRLYRMRCVEGWSLVIPWHGFELGRLLRAAEPLSAAKYVKFTALYDPQQMPGQREAILPWPYVEGLRLDEAMHPLTLLATGLDGGPLPNQNGAPIRLVVPWKYGLKNIKAIVRITLTSEQPQTTWNLAAPNEYGFYGNVNPAVDHPRWSQATERRIGQLGRIPTLPFNGYGKEVASLYKGMDLRRYF